MSKLVVVTGGTKGIGRAIIRKFAAEHCSIVTCARNSHDLQLLKTELENEFNIQVHATRADLTNRQELNDFVRLIVELKQPVDVLVNNAGFFIPGDICTEPDGNLDRMIESNLYSAYYLTRGLVPVMKAAGRGHIFNMGSVASFVAYPNGGSYAISKAALLGFSRCLRAELRNEGIRVTAIMPGATYTESWKDSPLAEDRFMPPEDVAEMVFASFSLSRRSVVEDIVIRPQLGDIND